MAIARIEIPLDEDTARIYTSAAPEDQKKLRLLFSMWLRDFAVAPSSLQEVMDELGNKAESRGVTPEILEQLLNAE